MTLSPANNARGGYPLGLAGASSATRYVGATASGAPASGTFEVGDFAIDQSGAVYVCTAAGSPGTWTAIGSGGSVWTTYLSLTGANFTNWTNDAAGTWSSDGSTFTVNAGSGVSAVARYTGVYIPVPCVIDWQFRQDSTGTSAVNQSIILGVGLPSSATGGPAGGVQCDNRDPAGNGISYLENLQTGGYAGDAWTYALDTWTSVRTVILAGAGAQVWNGATMLTQIPYGLGAGAVQYEALKMYAYSMTVKVRNVTVKTLTLPA